MQQTNLFSLETHSGPYETWPLANGLFFNGVDTHKKITGFLIEAQYICNDGYLLVTSMDCLFEETSNFILLDKDFNTIATNQLGVMYDTYLINTHWPVDSDAIRLHYYGDFFYTLHVERIDNWRTTRHRLKLKLFKEFASDPLCVQAINSLNERVRQSAAARGCATP
jgi:hypothetical protein